MGFVQNNRFYIVAGCVLSSLLAAVLFSSCSPASNPSDQTGSAKHFIRPMDIEEDGSNAPAADTATVTNNGLTSCTITITCGGGQITIGAPGHSSQAFPIPDDVTSVTVNGVNIPEGIPTIVVLPDGTKVLVVWEGNVIIIADTLEMN